ncbi:MAG: DUF4241 domain-containing protein [Chitinophagaceae bacterium]|nr:MAG: DUF4241 domain-containing protein [Chitinophagaceae bacterium]
MKYFLLFAVIFTSCQGIFTERKHPPVSTEKLDTIRSMPTGSIIKPSILESAFSSGKTEKVNDHDLLFYGITIGKLKVPSGRIISCDPMHIDEYGIPFTENFPKGEYPVQLSIAKMDNEEKVAFARITFKDAPVVTWKLALLPGQSPLPVDGEDYHGYSVDAGTAIFIDEEAKKAFDFKAGENMDADLFKAMNKHYRQSWRHTMYDFANYNLAAFNTGLGDGTFATYIGYDAAGSPVRLTTDFGLLNWKRPANEK